jgi:hypothetical protein
MIKGVECLRQLHYIYRDKYKLLFITTTLSFITTTLSACSANPGKTKDSSTITPASRTTEKPIVSRESVKSADSAKMPQIALKPGAILSSRVPARDIGKIFSDDSFWELSPESCIERLKPLVVLNEYHRREESLTFVGEDLATGIRSAILVYQWTAPGSSQAWSFLLVEISFVLNDKEGAVCSKLEKVLKEHFAHPQRFDYEPNTMLWLLGSHRYITLKTDNYRDISNRSAPTASESEDKVCKLEAGIGQGD